MQYSLALIWFFFTVATIVKCVPLPEKPTLEFSSFNEEREGVHARRRFNQTKQIEETKFGEDNKNETIHRREHHEGIDEEEIEVYRSHTNQTSIFQQGHEFNQGFDEITKSPLNANDNSTAIVEEPIEASGEPNNSELSAGHSAH